MNWFDIGGAMGLEAPEIRCNEEMEEWSRGIIGAGGVVTYQPTENGGCICSCGQEFMSFAKFAEHATQRDGGHRLQPKRSLAADMLCDPDPINHPPHYTFGKIEVIDVIEDWGLSFHLAQVVKYVARAKHKGKELEDLRKAKWFLDRLITSLEK